MRVCQSRRTRRVDIDIANSVFVSGFVKSGCVGEF
jgi:hypothetical protein